MQIQVNNIRLQTQQDPIKLHISSVADKIQGISKTLTNRDLMTHIPKFEENLAKLANRTVDQAAELERIEKFAFANFSGQLDQLESALGMLRLGHHVGWKVLVLIHSKNTLRKYESILGIKVREYFDPEGPSSDRCLGYRIAIKLGNFWKVVSGDIKIDHRREIEG